MGAEPPDHDLSPRAHSGAALVWRTLHFEDALRRDIFARYGVVSLVIAGGRGVGLGLDCDQRSARLWSSRVEHRRTFLGRGGNGDHAVRVAATIRNHRCGDRFADWLCRDAGGGVIGFCQKAWASLARLPATSE